LRQRNYYITKVKIVKPFSRKIYFFLR
jgi:hypothetical protein